MKDRIPLHPGRVKMTPVSGQANIYDIERADQPTQEGTPLNKATLLSDATAAALGLAGDDPTVDEALKNLLMLAAQGGAYVSVKLSDADGNPCEGIYVDIDKPVSIGESPFTDSTGTAIIQTDAGMHTVNILWPVGYAGGTESVALNVEETGKVYGVAVADAQVDNGPWTFETSAITYFRKGLGNIDVFVVGGGGGGGAVNPSSSTGAYRGVAAGGGGGYTATSEVTATHLTRVQIIVGAGGAGGNVTSGPGRDNGATGGRSSVVFGDVNISAAGGGGGNVGLGESTTAATATGGNGGSGGGGGYAYGSASLPNAAGAGGSDGSNGETGERYYPGTGQGRTTRTFGEEGGLRCSAGGGAGVGSDSNKYFHRPKGAYDAPGYGNGGCGKYQIYSSTTKTAKGEDGTAGVVMIRRHTA